VRVDGVAIIVRENALLRAENLPAQRRAGATEDFKEGVTAFLEKRPADFKGQ